MKNHFRSVIFLLISCFAQAQDGLILQTDLVLQQYVVAERQGDLKSYASMVQIFTATPLNYKSLRQAIRVDMRSCLKWTRKHPKNSGQSRQLLHQLRSLYKYVKEHKECCKAICFHEQLRQRYQFAFNNPNIVLDVQTTPELFGVDKCKYKCRAYFNKVAADLRKIDKFEDTIHADHELLKAHNYVYKIELIKIRNYVYHSNLYKYETRHFKLR